MSFSILCMIWNFWMGIRQLIKYQIRQNRSATYRRHEHNSNYKMQTGEKFSKDNKLIFCLRIKLSCSEFAHFFNFCYGLGRKLMLQRAMLQLSTKSFSQKETGFWQEKPTSLFKAHANCSWIAHTSDTSQYLPKWFSYLC